MAFWAELFFKGEMLEERKNSNYKMYKQAALQSWTRTEREEVRSIFIQISVACSLRVEGGITGWHICFYAFPYLCLNEN